MAKPNGTPPGFPSLDSFDSTPKPKPKTKPSRGPRGGIRKRLLWQIMHKKGYFPAAIFLLGLIISFGAWPTARDWELGALGYGLIPVAAWITAFAFILRYMRIWLKGYWQYWLGSALAVTVSLGILSMLDTTDGVMAEASLGGYWGGYLGGHPLWLGAVKIAAILLISPLLLVPREAAPLYEKAGHKSLDATRVASIWTGRHLKLLFKYLASHRPSISISKSPSGDLEQVPPEQADEPVPASQAREPRAGAAISPGPFEEDEEPPPEPRRKLAGKGKRGGRGWQLPSPELLSVGENRPMPQNVLEDMARHIEETLAEHRVEVAVDDIRTGPRVLRFGLVPGWVKKYRDSKGGSKEKDEPGTEMSRVKVQSILVREKDLALALKTPYLRLEAPVPGEALVGLEVPNPYPRTVALRSVTESSAFQKIAAAGKLPVALGEDTGGTPVAADLSELPHLLIAGATGSGKSVCINAVVASLLLTCSPEVVRLLMVDPKRVELTPFNGIPHLIAPVIVDTDEVLVVLRAIQNEMLRRYQLMEEMGVRNIGGYNRKAQERLPYLVIIIDELADLMMAAAYEVEQSLVRLAQLGRATGIHLILATQRPSVNVVTGLLKANIPARIAFVVASQVDSRVILDSVGAEKLLGKGDTLLLTSDSPKPKRVQGTFVDDTDIEKLVEFWKAQSGPPLPEIPLDEDAYSESGDADEDDPELLERAREVAERSPSVTPSLLQRRLQIGYPRALQLVHAMEEEGLIPAFSESSSFTGSSTLRDLNED